MKAEVKKGLPNKLTEKYPVYGIWTDAEMALGVVHSDGNPSSQIRLEQPSALPCSRINHSLYQINNITALIGNLTIK